MKKKIDKNLQKAIEIIGSKSELARLLNVTPQAINKWHSAPVNHCRAISEATGGLVTRHDLRPDIFDS